MRRLEAIEILCGQGGLNSSGSPALVPDTDLVAVESITYEDDTWKKEGGATKFNSVAVPAASGVTPSRLYGAAQQFITEAGVSELVCTNGQEVFVVGTGGVTKTILNDSAIVELAVRCPLVQGYDGTQKAIYYLNGLTASNGGGPWVYTGGSKMYRFGVDVGTVTADNATDTFTRTSHGLANGTRVCFHNSGGALPAGITQIDRWYVVNAAANTFQVSSVLSGSALNFTSNGTGTHTVRRLTMPVDWDLDYGPTWAFMHRGRMYTGGGGIPHNVYASVLNNHSDFINTGTLMFSVYPGEGVIAVGGISWRQKAYLFKYPTGIYVLDDESNNTADWGWKRVSKYVGAVSAFSIVEADDDVYFASPDGYIHALSAVQESGDIRSSAVKAMELGPFMQANADFSKIPSHPSLFFQEYPAVQGVYYAKKRKVLFGYTKNPNVLSADNLPVNSLLLTLDIHRSNKMAGVYDAQYSVSTRDQCETLATYVDPTTADESVLAGNSSGFLYKLDQSARTKDSAGYSGRFETKTFYPYGNTRNANMRELEVTFAPASSNNSITISVYQDGTLSTSATLTDASTRMRLYGDCRRFYIVGENSVNNESFSVSSIAVRFVPGNME